MIRNRELDSRIIDYINERIGDDNHAVIPLREFSAHLGNSISTIWQRLIVLENRGQLIKHEGTKNCYHKAEHEAQ